VWPHGIDETSAGRLTSALFHVQPRPVSETRTQLGIVSQGDHVLCDLVHVHVGPAQSPARVEAAVLGL